MIESGRKHRPFDFPYPMRWKLATPVWELQPRRDGPERLEPIEGVAAALPNLAEPAAVAHFPDLMNEAASRTV